MSLNFYVKTSLSRNKGGGLDSDKVGKYTLSVVSDRRQYTNVLSSVPPWYTVPGAGQ